MIFLIEFIALCVIFTVLVMKRMKKPLTSILYSYPPAIVERVIDMGMVEDKD